MNSDHDQIDGLIRAALAVDPAPGLENRIRQRVRSEASGPRSVFRPVLWGVGLALAVALAAVMIDLPRQEFNRPESASGIEGVTKPVEVSASVSNPPAASQPSTAASTRLSTAMPAVVNAATNPPHTEASPLAAAALTLPPLNEFSLGTSMLVTAALPDSDLPHFEIRTFSLLASNEGAPE